jgi:hypothetical protein
MTGRRLIRCRSINRTISLIGVSSVAVTTCHHILNLATMGMHIVLGELTRTEQKYEPARTMSWNTSFDVSEKVSFGNETHETVGRIDNRQSADSALEQQSSSIRNRGAATYRRSAKRS